MYEEKNGGMAVLKGIACHSYGITEWAQRWIDLMSMMVL